ncbi:glycosyltransferase, CESA-like subfamily [Geotalea daltonii FRC-32]|uniref:Glycosyltransferase, CESA-like subfamily n=1 Tax=Geotalea daltonii (strain DSM 22248 / JCM 15807 / FRC-32) TaxID=316067 RepID=B9M2W4_GEODF|nr:glycosyltransferase family 2 protein [Geotalea daltonii]ACM21310.1 glycosyltransferase, CESA-like subfamily [Geotalea daltonii FRC-32]
MEILAFLFWVLIILIFYPYVIYPGMLYLLGLVRNRKVAAGSGKPPVTIIIPAFNEEAVIGKKLQNTLMLHYPRELLQIIVISDASTDGTDEIAGSFAKEGVKLLRNETRKGKTYGLNCACDLARGEVLVFTDADSMFHKEMLNLLVRNFADKEIGLVTGSTRYLSKAGDGSMVATMGKYTLFERWIKEQESRIGSCIGADGAIFAMRREYYRPLDEKDINDFVIPLNVVRQGKRVVLDKDVHCLEEHADDEGMEFSRQIRITNRTIRALISNRDMLNPFRHGFFAWMLWSHKMLRFLLPWFAILLYGVIVFLALAGSLFHQVLFFLIAAFVAFFLFIKPGGSAILALMRSFVQMNEACLLAWLKIFRKKTIVVWDKSNNP